MPETPVRIETRGRAFVVTIDNPPVNVISQAVRAGLLEACKTAQEALDAGEIDRVVLAGAGRAFVAGADAREFDGPALDPQLPEVLSALMQLPAIAAIGGAALGGGCEIALACRARVVGPKALIGLPEVTLGVVPGAGGTQRLPRLVGLATALELIPTGRLVGPEEALSLGMADSRADDPLEAALLLDAEVFERPSVDDLPAPAADPEAERAARTLAAKRKRGENAPKAAIDLVAASATLPLDSGLARERATFLDLRTQPQARALRHVFFAERGAGASAQVKAQKPKPISTALVAGGGTMGAAICYALSQAGIHVTLLEQDESAAVRGREKIAGLFADGVKRGKISAEAAAEQQTDGFAYLHGAATALPPVDLAIEAVFEDLSVKRSLFARFGSALPQSTILATNTSYLDPNAIADGLPDPGRFLGLHFFAPAHVMKLVEVVRANDTTPQTLASAFALTKRLGKIAVEAGVCDGFIGNRILTRYRQAADILLLEGALPEEVDAAATEFGLAMGPYAAQDLSGLDIAYANRQRNPLRDIAGHRYVPIADRMVESLQRLGRKTGAGWYDYTENGQAQPAAAVAALVREAAKEAGIAPRHRSSEVLAKQLMLAIIAEGIDILADNIAGRAADVDLVMIHGYGFPRWRGGPMQLADEWGLETVRADLAALAEEDPLSWRVPPLLDRLIAEKRSLAGYQG